MYLKIDKFLNLNRFLTKFNFIPFPNQSLFWISNFKLLSVMKTITLSSSPNPLSFQTNGSLL